MHPRRLARFTELITHKVSSLIIDLKDPAMGFVTITGVRVSNDVTLAKIFYSVLGSEQEKEATAAALERAKPYIRHELSQMESMRRVPQIMFIYDKGIERAARVNEILHSLDESSDNKKNT
jgi:ribosome-binding factor A